MMIREADRIQIGTDPYINLLTFDTQSLGRLVAATSGGPVQMFDIASGRLCWSHEPSWAGKPAIGMFTFCFTDDGARLVAASDSDEVFYFFESDSGKILHQFQLPIPGSVGSDFHAVNFNKTGDLMLVNSCFATACISSIDGTALWSDGFNGNACCAGSLHVTNSGQVIYPNPNDQFVIRHVATGQIVKSFPGTGNFRLSCDKTKIIQWQPGLGFTVFSIADDKTRLVVPFKAALHSCIFDWSSEQGLLVVNDDTSDQECLRFFSTESGNELGRFEMPNETECLDIQFEHANEHRLLASCDNGSIFVLEIMSSSV